MFTSVITARSEVCRVSNAWACLAMQAVIGVPTDFLAAHGGTAIGASIACSGCCITAIDLGPNWCAVDVYGESVSRTTLGTWRPGSRINLERSLRVGDELGGH
jgi:riboflavin synthase